jgi:hypothetical protein
VIVYTGRTELPSLAAIFPTSCFFSKAGVAGAEGPGPCGCGCQKGASHVDLGGYHYRTRTICAHTHSYASDIIYPAHSPGPYPFYELPLGTDLETAKILVSICKQSLQSPLSLSTLVFNDRPALSSSPPYVYSTVNPPRLLRMPLRAERPIVRVEHSSLCTIEIRNTEIPIGLWSGE